MWLALFVSGRPQEPLRELLQALVALDLGLRQNPLDMGPKLGLAPAIARGLLGAGLGAAGVFVDESP